MYWVFIRDGVLPGFLVGGTGFFFFTEFPCGCKRVESSSAPSSTEGRAVSRSRWPPDAVCVLFFFVCFFFRPSFVSFGVFVFFWRPSAASSLFRVTNVRSGFLVRQYGVQ